MYCPSCGGQFQDGQKYCRACGANLAIITKAIKLSDTIGRSDRGAWPKIKAALEDLGIDLSEVSDRAKHRPRISERSLPVLVKGGAIRRSSWSYHQRDQIERRENHIVRGCATLFSGIGLAIFLYYIAGVLILKIPPEKAAKIPFEIEPVIRMAWLFGLIPIMTGLGQIVGGLLTRSPKVETPEIVTAAPSGSADESPGSEPGGSASVTDHTTELLEPAQPRIRVPQGIRQRE